MFDWFQCAAYESPGAIMLGPLLSALFVNFATFDDGQLCLTPAGERYLQDHHRRTAL